MTNEELKKNPRRKRKMDKAEERIISIASSLSELLEKVRDSLRVQTEKTKQAERRAEVAERALLTACVNIVKGEEDNVNMELLARVVYTKYLRKAEKELAEDKKTNDR